LNQYDFRVPDVHVTRFTNIGEKSGIRLRKVIPRITWLLFRGFWERLFFKYVIKGLLRPLVFFYILSFFLWTASIPLGVRLLYMWVTAGVIPGINTMAVVFTLISGLQTLFSADVVRHGDDNRAPEMSFGRWREITASGLTTTS